MKTKETKEWIEKIKNAIKTIKRTSASDFKDFYVQHNRLNILFYDNGNKFKFGIDSMYSLQVQNFTCKNHAIRLLEFELENEELHGEEEDDEYTMHDAYEDAGM